MYFHVQKWPDISNGWSDIPSKKEAKKKKERKEKTGKTKGKKIGGKERKKVKSTKRKEREREGMGGRKRLKNRKEKEKRVWEKYLDKQRKKEVLYWDLNQCIGIPYRELIYGDKF